MKIGARIYYLKNTGEVIYTIPDKMGFVKATTLEEDWDNYAELNKYVLDSFDCIQLEYGALQELLFNNKANSYGVDLNSGELVFKYLNKYGEEVEAPAGEFVKKKNEIESVKEELGERIDILSDAVLDLTFEDIDLEELGL